MVDPETYQPGALQGHEGSDRLGASLSAVADCGSDDEGDWSDHCDEWEDGLTCPVASLEVVRFVATRARGDALSLMEVEARDAGEASICGTLACVAGLLARLALVARL